MVTTSTQQARLNFPLPIELRETIYDSFMGVKHDPLDEDWSEAPSRRFHIEILQINKTIRNEAGSYLYRTHQFTRLDYFLPNFDSMMLAYNVPIVNQPELEPSFINYALHIGARVQSFEDGEALMQRDVQYSAGTVWILASDLPALSEMLRAVALTASAEFVLIDTPRGHKIDPYRHSGALGYRLKLEITAYPTKRGAQLSDEAQLAILQDLRIIKGVDDTKFHGFAASEAVETRMKAVVRDMAPSLVWFHAREWESLDLRLKLKRRADQLSPHSRDKMMMALGIYTTSWVDMDRSRLRTSDNAASRAKTPALAVVNGYHRSLSLDILVSTCQIMISCGMLAGPTGMLNNALSGRVVDLDTVPARTIVTMCRLQLDAAILAYIDGSLGEAELRDRLRSMNLLYEGFPQADLLRSDIDLAEELLRLPGVTDGNIAKVRP